MRLNTVRLSFLVSLIVLIITVGLFWNMGVYVDDAGTSPDIVYGGAFWLNMSWFRLFLSFVLTVVLGILGFRKNSYE